MNLDSQAINLTIDLYDGAYGKTLMMKARELPSLIALRNVFVRLAKEKSFHYSLFPQSNIVGTGLSKFNLLSLNKNKNISSLKLISGDQLEWRQNATDWEYTCALVQALIDHSHRGRSGHQYLTKEGIEDVLVILSYNEK